MHMHMHMHTSWQAMTWIFLKEWKIFLGVIVFFPHLKIKTSLNLRIQAASLCLLTFYSVFSKLFRTF